RAIRQEAAGLDIVPEISVKDRNQSAACNWLLNRDEQLDSPVEVARHPVGTRDKHPLVAAMVEVENASVFQEAIHDADHFNIVTQSRHAGAQAADAADI